MEYNFVLIPYIKEIVCNPSGNVCLFVLSVANPQYRLSNDKDNLKIVQLILKSKNFHTIRLHKNSLTPRDVFTCYCFC